MLYATCRRPTWTDRSRRDCSAASVVLSRMAAMASRTSFITRCVGQLSSEGHSSHRAYAFSLTQGTGARGPSMSRMICPTEIDSAGRANA